MAVHFKRQRPAHNMGLLPWLCGATRRSPKKKLTPLRPEHSLNSMCATAASPGRYRQPLKHFQTIRDIGRINLLAVSSASINLSSRYIILVAFSSIYVTACMESYKVSDFNLYKSKNENDLRIRFDGLYCYSNGDYDNTCIFFIRMELF